MMQASGASSWGLNEGEYPRHYSRRSQCPGMACLGWQREGVLGDEQCIPCLQRSGCKPL